MNSNYLMTALLFGVIFILFLVISRILNSIISYQNQIAYLLKTEKNYRAEEVEVQSALLEEELSRS